MLANNFGTRIGRDVQTDAPVVVAESARGTGIYILGKKGTGKSSCMRQLISHDMVIGDGFALIEPHGDLIDEVISRIPSWRLDDVIYWDVRNTGHPFGLNVYTCNNPDEIELAVDFIMQMFAKLWNIQRADAPRLRNYIRHTAFVLLYNPGHTIVEIPLILKNEEYCRALLENVTHRPLRLFWDDYFQKTPAARSNELGPLLNKLDEFTSTSIVYYMMGQSRTSLDFREIMDTKKILLVRLPEGVVGREIVELLGTIIVAEILRASFSRENIPPEQRVPFRLYADEFDQFTTPDFATIISKARKYGIETITAHQLMSQLDEETRAAIKQVGTKIVFSITDDDAREAAGLFEPETIRVQDGEEPIPVPHPQVVQHLLKQKTHSMSSVTQFIREYLLEFQTTIDEMPGEYNPEKTTLSMCKYYQYKNMIGEHAVNLIGHLNKYLEDCMNDNDATRHLAAMFEDAVWCIEVDKMLKGFTGNRIEQFVSDLENGIYNRRLQAEICSELIFAFPEDHIKIMCSYRLIRYFFADLWSVGSLLSLYPITVNTDRKRPRMVSKQTSRAELGDMLKQQPAYHALCRVESPAGATQQWMRLFPPVDFSDDLEQNRAYIQNAARRLYGRSRADVDQEIEQREQLVYQRARSAAQPKPPSVEASPEGDSTAQELKAIRRRGSRVPD
jgi:hypothetical protein